MRTELSSVSRFSLDLIDVELRSRSLAIEFGLLILRSKVVSHLFNERGLEGNVFTDARIGRLELECF
jgi:hypothetical protein